MFGKINKARTAARPHGYSLPHSEIFKKISKKLNKAAPKSSVKSIREIIKNKKQLTYAGNKENKPIKISANGLPFILIQEKNQHKYHNIDLGSQVEGFGELEAHGQLILNPMDAGKLGIKNGDAVKVRSDKSDLECSAIIRKIITPGHVLLNSSVNDLEFESNPCPVKIIKQDV
jgi:anaerobic selenocysteine-containing dehydrogenase